MRKLMALIVPSSFLILLRVILILIVFELPLSKQEARIKNENIGESYKATDQAYQVEEMEFNDMNKKTKSIMSQNPSEIENKLDHSKLLFPNNTPSIRKDINSSSLNNLKGDEEETKTLEEKLKASNDGSSKSLAFRQFGGSLPSTQAAVNPFVPPFLIHGCDPSNLFYRTMDGSCNNLKNPCWGKVFEPYLRYLPPVYANGRDSLRTRANGLPLPNPRLINRLLLSPQEPSIQTSIPHLTGFMVMWSQMVAHDLQLTAIPTVQVRQGDRTIYQALNCCNMTSPNLNCIPIIVPDHDRYYPAGYCMNFIRSTAYTNSPNNCQQLPKGSPREQLNQQTAYLDASLVYGTSDSQMRQLRENNGKSAYLKMEIKNGYIYPPRAMPGSSIFECSTTVPRCDGRCFKTGDPRVNQNVMIASIQTMWLREHNRLVQKFKLKTDWSEEKRFQEARKIIGAMLQHVTYNEFLPMIIPARLMKELNLNVPTVNYQYNPRLNPTLRNVFSTAAYRFGHSMISTRVQRKGLSFAHSPLFSKDYFKMDELCHPLLDFVGDVMTGQSNQRTQRVDTTFTKQITDHLESTTTNGPGGDLFSFDVQRGRDHGLPPYNAWRQLLGLPRARDYSDLKQIMPPQIAEILQEAYGPGAVSEIDLFVGGLAEYPLRGGIFGQTFTIIVADQFKNLKFGDRFWYENKDHAGAFSPRQIFNIQSTTLASLLCRNADIVRIQPWVFQTPSEKNPKKSCSEIVKGTDININFW